MTSSRDLSKALKFIDRTQVLTTATGTVTLDLSLYNIFDITLTGNTTLAFSNPPNLTGETYSFMVIVRQGATAYTLTQPSGVVTVKSAAIVTPVANKQKDYIYSRNGTVIELREGAST